MIKYIHKDKQRGNKMIKEYANERHITEGYMWHVVTENGLMPHYPYAKKLDDLKAFVEEWGDIIEEQMEDTENNYGLAFYARGYDGQAQQSFIKYWKERGVSVF